MLFRKLVVVSICTLASVAVAAVSGTSVLVPSPCIPPNGNMCPMPVKFSDLPDMNPAYAPLVAFEPFGNVPPSWLFFNPIANKCQLNPFAIPKEVSAANTTFIHRYTKYCESFLPCEVCYNAPRRPSATGVPAVQVPRDAIMQKDFSIGWWYLAAQLDVFGSNNNNNNNNTSEEEEEDQEPPSQKASVFMSVTYTNSPKTGQLSSILPAGSKGDFVLTTDFSEEDMVRSESGTVSNKFAPHATTGVSPFPWKASYDARDLNITFRLVVGSIGEIGSKYSFIGTTEEGARVNLIGTDVSGVILQGDRGFIDVPVIQSARSPLAGTNYFSLRLDVTGTVTSSSGVRKSVSGVSDFDFQWANGNTSPLYKGTSWIWFNLRLPGKCNLFINQMRQADGSMITGPGSDSYSLLHSLSLPSQGPGYPVSHKQLPEVQFSPLRTWTSPVSNITYPQTVILTLGDYAEFALVPDLKDSGEILSGPHDLNAFIESGVRVELISSSAAYYKDCLSKSASLTNGNSRKRAREIRSENRGVMEYQGFALNVHPLHGLLEGGLYSRVSV